MSMPVLLMKSFFGKSPFWTQVTTTIEQRGFLEAIAANISSAKIPMSRYYEEMERKGNVVWRGIGTSSLLAQTLREGHIRRSFGKDTLCPVEHTIHGNSKWIVSATSKPDTAAVYTSIGSVPDTTAILELAEPEVYFNPIEVLITNPESAVAFDKSQHGDEHGDYAFEAPKVDSLDYEPSATTLVKNDDEVAIVTGHKDRVFTRPLQTSLSAVYEVVTPGTIAKKLKLASGEEKAYHIRSHHNPDFEITPVSVKITGGHYEASLFPRMNENALKGGLIKEGERLLTIEDARAIFPTEESLHQFQYDGITKTLRITAAPQEIAVGDRPALMAYIREALEVHKRYTVDPSSSRSLLSK